MYTRIDISALNGKTISYAVEVDARESIVLVFTDDTYAFFDIDFYGDSHDMIVMAECDDCFKRAAGIITEAEYEATQLVREKRRKAEKIRVDLRKLAELKAKYGE